MKQSDVLPDHVIANRQHWDATADAWVEAGERSWARSEPVWGIWQVPESEVEMLPGDMRGMRAVELGCGTGYVSAWMTRRGATVSAVDNSERQLATARRLAAEHGVELRLIHGNAEATPFEDGEFDFAISEYGAALWCDPYLWLPEAHRILRSGGRLAFLTNHPLVAVFSPYDGSTPLAHELVRPYFDIHRIDWTDVPIDPGGVEFNLPLSRWFELFRRTGFEVEDFREPRPAEGGDRVSFIATADWAQRWPTEMAFKLRKRE